MKLFNRPAPEIPGLVTTGHAPRKRGKTVYVPVYEIAPAKPGRRDINTLEGWNAFAAEQNAKTIAKYLPAEAPETAQEILSIGDMNDFTLVMLYITGNQLEAADTDRARAILRSIEKGAQA